MGHRGHRSLPDPSAPAPMACLVVMVAALLQSGCVKINEPTGADGAISPYGGGAPADSPGTSLGGYGGNIAIFVPDDAGQGCVNLQCRQSSCAGGSTSVSGTVYAPNGRLPLSNVLVYVPNQPLQAFGPGASCVRCSELVSGQPIAATVSGADGRFKIDNVPAGRDIPLVFQVGKWRRQVAIPRVAACRDNPIVDPNLSRLPRKRSEGDLPRIAVTTGGCDRLGCLLPKLGVDSSELGAAGDGKAVTFYRGADDGSAGSAAVADSGPGDMTEASSLWRKTTELAKYDMVLLSCECSEARSNKGNEAWDAMTRYLGQGGRIFGSDFMYVWYRYSPDARLSNALAITGAAPEGNNPLTIDTSFARGRALADWLKVVDPSSTYGQIVSNEVFDNVVGAAPAAVRVWASSTSPRSDVAHPRILSINIPPGVPAPQQCGRAVHLDAHISTLTEEFSASAASAHPSFPGVCGGDLMNAEVALAYLFFDLAGCVPDDAIPPPIGKEVP